MNDCSFDCAHFISRRFLAGNLNLSSYGSLNLKNKLLNGGYGIIAKSISELQPGDLAFNPKGGKSGHAMLITRIYNNKIYVTHHSGANANPNKDKDTIKKFDNGYIYIHITY